jgi:hypothetical protein
LILNSQPEPNFEIKAPRLFGMPAVLMIWAYGIFLIIPVVAAFLAVTMIRLSLWTMLIPLLTLAATAWFVPVGQGNAYIRRKLRSPQVAPISQPAYVVQLSLNPRLRKGLRAALEDADDFGYLSFDEDGFRFDGDSIQLRAPYANIKEVWQQNVGWRGRFIYGPRVTIVVEGSSGVQSLEFAERSSTLISDSKKTARELWRQFEEAQRQFAHSSSSSSNSPSSSSSPSSLNSIKSACSTSPSEAFSTASQGSPFSARG